MPKSREALRQLLDYLENAPAPVSAEVERMISSVREELLSLYAKTNPDQLNLF